MDAWAGHWVASALQCRPDAGGIAAMAVWQGCQSGAADSSWGGAGAVGGTSGLSAEDSAFRSELRCALRRRWTALCG